MARSAWIDDELALLQEQVARFAERELRPHAERWEQQRVVDRDAWRAAGRAGILCASIPEEYGGGGGNQAHEAIIAQELIRAGVGGGFGIGNGVSSGIVAHYILAYGTEAQKQRWLPRLATGEFIGAVAMTEPGAGSDLQSVRTTARRDDNEYVINGQKTFITNGQNCDLVVVVAKTDPTLGAKGISLIVVETADCVGFQRGKNLNKVGMHAQDTSELFFTDARVPKDNLLGVEGRGFIQLMEQLAWERLILALNATVMMERAVEITTAYVRDRTAFGQPLLAFQNTQFKLAEAKTKAVIARTFVDDLMVKILRGEADPVTAAMAKFWTSDTLGEVVDECVQLHGGYGYMAEYEIGRLWADARVMRIYGGANEIMKSIVARAL
ncbi:MAG: acyl-CoA dehydrogenase family protein [Hyphomonadaceae bacterium]|nr:acyl-CoA dehydrogenase family protein [Hyphomonadaceae bacterium]